MNDNSPILVPTKNMIEAYEKLLQFTVKEAKVLEKEVGPALHKIIDTAEKEISKIIEITEEDMAKVSDYLKRDLHEAATFMAETDSDFNTWLGLDMEIVENFLLEQFKKAADQTRIELAKIQFAAETAEYHTGEITGPGVLVCDVCEENLRFEKTGHIPPCPKCHKTVFHRLLRK